MISRTANRVFTVSRRTFSATQRIIEKRAKYYSNPAAGTPFLIELLIPFLLVIFDSVCVVPVRLFAGAENPTYLKEPMDKMFVIAGFAGMFYGLGCIFHGLYSMSLGINKVEK
jgi:hypothetical protein